MNKSRQIIVVVKQTVAKQPAVSNVKIVLGEPILINTNSFDTVAQVFRSIGKEAGIKKYKGNKRDLLMIVRDGLPAVLGWHIIFNTFFCNTCQLSFSELDDLKLRSTNNHQTTVSVVDIFEFDWVILLLGYGHYLINSLKTVIDFCWNIFFKELAIIVGYKSPKALLYCRVATDTLKSMELIRLAFKAGVDELMVPYVRYCRLKLKTPCFIEYCTWRYSVKSQNYNLMAYTHFEYLHSIIMLKTGNRETNSELIDEAKENSSPLFCSRNKKNYIFLNTLNNINRSLTPAEIQDFIEKNETIKCKNGLTMKHLILLLNRKIKKLNIGYHWEYRQIIIG
jgi:hypothetical protein